jgi:hypothetical protein
MKMEESLFLTESRGGLGMDGGYPKRENMYIQVHARLERVEAVDDYALLQVENMVRGILSRVQEKRELLRRSAKGVK